MRQPAILTIIAVSMAAMIMGTAAPAGASAGTAEGLTPTLIISPVQINATSDWQGHWAEQDLAVLRASTRLQPWSVINNPADPDSAMPIGLVADVLLYMYGTGGEEGDPLDRAVTLGLVRSSDFAGEQINLGQPVSRQQYALLMTRAIGVQGAEDPVSGEITPDFADAAEIEAPYLAAVALLQGEGLLAGYGGQFHPGEPITYAQAVRTLRTLSAWTQERVIRLTGLNPAEATYLIDGQKVTLSGGVAEQPAAPGSATKAVTRLMDQVAAADLNGDGKVDLAAVLTYQGGGSGTFYYLAVLLNDGTPVEAAFLGDRIAVQQVRIVDGKVAVDLLTRGPEDPMVVRPYLKETRIFEVKDGALVPVGS